VVTQYPVLVAVSRLPSNPSFSLRPLVSQSPQLSQFPSDVTFFIKNRTVTEALGYFESTVPCPMLDNDIDLELEGQGQGQEPPLKKPKRFQCQHCQRFFARLEHLQRHERTRKHLLNPSTQSSPPSQILEKSHSPVPSAIANLLEGTLYVTTYLPTLDSD
jgi:hypothetical protein